MIAEKVVWKLLDRSNTLVGFFFMEDGEMKLEDLKGNQLKVSPDTTLQQAIRIILLKQSMTC